MKARLLGAIAFILISVSSFAETRYITDTQYIPIRSGGGNQFRIVHRGLKSGTKLTVIEAPEGDWAHIKTDGGTEGWIRKQYLINQPTAALRLDTAQDQLTKATKRIAQLESNLTNLKSEHTSLSSTGQKLSTEHQQLTEKYNKLKSLSADAVSLNHRYQELLTKHELLKTEFDTVHAENDRLKSDKTINQWLFGAGLIILGMILMLILPALKPQKSSGDWVN